MGRISKDICNPFCNNEKVFDKINIAIDKTGIMEEDNLEESGNGQDHNSGQQEALCLLRENLKLGSQMVYLEELLWEALMLFQGTSFYTAKKLEFTYTIKGNEMFVSRKEKSITRATVNMSFRKAVAMDGFVSGPKKLGTFGASYLYPVFIKLGVIHVEDICSNL